MNWPLANTPLVNRLLVNLSLLNWARHLKLGGNKDEMSQFSNVIVVLKF